MIKEFNNIALKNEVQLDMTEKRGGHKEALRMTTDGGDILRKECAKLNERGNSDLTTKEWLMRAWKMNDEIDALITAKQAAFDRCTSITAKLKAVTVSGGGDVHDKMDYWLEVSSDVDEHLLKLKDTSGEIFKAIQKVDNATYRTLLIKRYINFETWEQIAVEMHYSWRQVIRLHGQALIEVKMS